MKWRTVVPICVSLSCGGRVCRGWDPPPLPASQPPPPVCTCPPQMSAMEAHGLKSQRYARTQPKKGFAIRKLPEKSIWEVVRDHKGVREMGFPVGFLIRKWFLKGGSRALPL